MKKLLALLLCTVMLLSVFSLVACGDEGGEKNTEKNTENNTDGESVTEEIEEIDLTDEIPDGVYDFGGREFIITAPWPDYWGINNYDVEELTSDTVYDEVYYRNRKTEQRFNCKISAVEIGSTDTIVEDLSPLILSDSGAFDLIAFAYSTGSYGLISSGLLCPWNDIPLINYEKPWWNKSAINCGTLNGTTYFNAGSFNWYSIAFTVAFFFNETVRTQAGIEDLYALVENGEWTIDKLIEYCRLVAKDDGNGKWNADDTYGLVGFGPDQFATGFGFVIAENHGDGTYTVNIGNEKHQQILNKLVDLLKKNNHLAYNQSDCTGFKEDRALFMLEWLYNIDQYRTMDSDYGIIPLPKWDEAQEQYCSFSQSWGLANALPVTTTPEDYEFIGAVVESLACESYNKILPAYYDYTLKGRDTRDTESWKMLDLINSTLVYDFGYFYIVGPSTRAVTLALANLVKYGREKTDLASYVAEYENEWITQYDEIMTFGK